MEREGGVAAARGGGGGWREAFLNRHRREPAADDVDGELPEPRARSLSQRRAGSRPRESSRPREASRPPADAPPAAGGDAGEAGAGAAGVFDQKAVLDQDRALIEQLTQRQTRRERSVVRKPPPPPKVTPYRGSSSASTPTGSERKPESPGGLLGGPPSPAAASAPAAAGAEEAPEALAPAPAAAPVATAPAAAANALAAEAEALTPAPLAAAEPSGADAVGARPPQQRSASPAPASALERTLTPADSGPRLAPAAKPAAEPLLEPVVPKTGELFTASDIDSIMDRLNGTKDCVPAAGGEAAAGAGAGEAAPPPAREQCVQNFGDISQEFFRNNRMDVPARQEAPPARSLQPVPERPPGQTDAEFQVPDRSALKQQISAIDSWLEEDMSAREQLSAQKNGKPSLAPSTVRPPVATVADPTVGLQEAMAGAGPGGTGTEAEIFQRLEDVKRRKSLGERVSPVLLKEVASQAKPLFPTMALEQLVKALRLFTSARHEDHDLYLRILGEIPVQVRGMTPESLTSCVRVLWRLRLHEETYLELFSMEAMNMIRAKRKPQARAPRRPPAPSRNVDAAATAAAGGSVPVPPAAPPPEAPSPFSAAQLVLLGNALSQLGAKHPPRFMDVFQEQLGIAIPRLTQEECELVNPTFAMSQLLHDPLRRAFLERCAQVDAGKPAPEAGAQVGAAPDIAQYQRDSAARRRRQKHFRNVYVIEASVRKETFSFFSSLPAEVRAYLDRLHADGAALEHEGITALAKQIAAVLDQLGVSCDMKRMAGPLSLHVVAKATNPRAEVSEIVYECSDAEAFYARRQDDKGAPPQHTACAKLRHRLLQRLGVQLTHISVWEWQQMSEAQRVNYMVKVQSLQ